MEKRYCPECCSKMERYKNDWWCNECEDFLSTMYRREVSGEDYLACI
jgi:hypothetical protein